MRDLLHSRRGSVAFATVIALVPLIGVVSLGAEAGSWYVTQKNAQNAADAAAYSGALRLACTIAGATNCDPQSVDYRGKEFAAQNAFCNSSPADNTAYPDSRCATSLPSGISRVVQIDIGDYVGDSNAGTFTTPPAGTGNAVRAIVRQQQPAYLAAVLGFKTVTIPAQAIALVQNPTKLCALALGPDTGALKLGGNLSNNGTGCGMMSDTTVQFASTPTFTGSGWAIYGVSGCTPSGTCSNPGVTHNYFMPNATNPLSKLDSESFNSRTGSSNPETKLTSCPTSPAPPAGTKTCFTASPNAPPATGAYGSLSVTTGDWLDFAPGTYVFYNATIKINGGTVTCNACTKWPPAGTGLGVTLVLLGDSSLSISGGTVALSAPVTNSFSSDLNGVLIDDQAPTKSKNAVTINGGGTVALGGATYFPKVDVTWNGGTQSSNTTCSEVIAKTLTMSGGGFLSTQGCGPIAYTQVVALVR
ncbi:pilus assembly protein TadG-related protein [Bradyrhizobium manausense]|uniref:Pilus assembly protein TadG n=1 Tax=Bradyrhizobium manausense TaxID=989370 RepID=A0A0R3DNA2_9BRAD|nr:pilus assembly protein TadG-related protein [Bradyrhizobium manausense]KRQ08287.1 pilus assembly protein TadG [Bradyrhizobium manausense]